MKFGGPLIVCSTRKMKPGYKYWRMNWRTPLKELLAKQMASVCFKEGEGNALVADKRNFKGKTFTDTPHSRFQSVSSSPEKEGESTNNYKKTLKCYRCGKIGHIKRYCQTKESNMAQVEKAAEEEEDAGRCFVAEAGVVDALASFNFERDWIMDSRDNTVYHVEKEGIGVINKKQEDSKDVQTSDVVAATEEIKEADPETSNKSLDIEDVEVEPEHEVSETTYGNGDHSGESIEGVVVEVEVSGQLSAVSESITSSVQILKADGEADGQINEEVDLEGSISYTDTNGMIFESSEATKQFIEKLERKSSGGSYVGIEASKEIRGQIVTDLGASPDNTIVKELRERGSLETQECEIQHEDDSRGSQRPKRNSGKSACYRDENFIKTHSCFFGGSIISGKPSSFEEGKSVEKVLLRSSPRHVQKLRLSSSTTSSG
ncbi:uncharacterized protein LOC132069373 [Lycium ferocissimum]|uniref:uncharacterized protein LOC132069373 n=1 Tax=Lycium ferocissimum TaxID=112874 RepID=UPI002814B438|nr:uncharacterized protein LOC132069373 [Lycium ferocissimum]